ncbi:MAG: hypothetical protein JW395_2296 [Nitrospira sp.]|nr:hypothetical protein [Nitrospira sp.]
MFSTRSGWSRTLHSKLNDLLKPRYPSKIAQDWYADKWKHFVPEPDVIGRYDPDQGSLSFPLEGRIHRPPDARVPRNAGNLAEITKNRLNLGAILAMEPEEGYLDPLRVIMSRRSFKRQLAGTYRPITKVSRYMMHHAAAMEACGVVEPSETAINNMPVFTTPKKNLDLRLIQDGRPINIHFAKPPEMFLPRIHDVIDRILGAEYVADADGVSYFYQIPLSPEVRDYFGCRLAGGRGLFKQMRFCSLPMGFSWAPCIAQRIANTIISDHGMAWVDNFFVLGTSLADFKTHRDAFLERAAKANLLLDDHEMLPKQDLVALGIEFDLRTKCYRMAPDWALKAVTRLEEVIASANTTPTEVYKAAGTIVWHSHVTRRRLCNLPELFALVSRLASQIGTGKTAWDSPLQWPEGVKSEITAHASHLRSNVWISKTEETPETAEVWSDASSTHWAFLAYNHGELIHASQGPTKPNMHIFLAELSAAMGGIMALYRKGIKKGIVVNVDNTAAAICLQRGISTNRTANTWMAGLPDDAEYRVQWVSTRVQLSDNFTRVAPGHRHPPAVPPKGSRIESLRHQVEKTENKQRFLFFSGITGDQKSGTPKRETHCYSARTHKCAQLAQRNVNCTSKLKHQRGRAASRAGERRAARVHGRSAEEE